MVRLFMEGINPDFRQEIECALEDFVARLTDALVTSASATGRRETILRRRVDEVRADPTKQFFEHLDSYSAEQHVQPVVSAVANLPKEEQAGMAESVVSRTSFKRRVSHDAETVGGPIDVAVISKFFANYYPGNPLGATARSAGGGDSQLRK